MVYVMMYDTWKERTKLTMKPRSSKLKAIDAAIRKYHEVPTEQSLKDLRLAVHNWKMYKGYDAIAGKPAWLTSERNYRGAISSSRLEVDGLQMSKGVVTDVSPGIANLKNRLKKQAMDKLKKVVPVDELETARLAHKLAS